MLKKTLAVLTGLLMLFSTACSGKSTKATSTSTSTKTHMEYSSQIFEKDILKIEITTTEDDWQYLLENATSKPWISGNVTIDGTAFDNVGIKTKGNTSLKQVANSDSDRYSLKIKFDKYIDGQSCYGLDRLVLNNIYADSTYMKEYLSYKLFNYMEVPSSLCTFAEIYVNGEQYGVFLAIEETEASFLTRNYGYTNSVKTYKPESMDMDQENDNIGNQENGNTPNQNGNQNQMPDGNNQGPNNGNMPNMNLSNMISITDKEGNAVSLTDIADISANNFDIQNIESFTDSDGNITKLSDIDMPSIMNLDLSKIVSATDTNGNTLSLSEYTLSVQGFGNNGGPSFGGNNQQEGNVPTDGGNTGTDETNNQKRPNGMNGGGMNGGDKGVSLVYTDDDADSYSNIFDNAITDVDSWDKARLISSLKAISQGENIEDYIDVDEVLRYTACNTFLVNLDSYFSSMGHNYILAENNGVLSMVPWDYNLAFGTFQGSSASDVINYAIDTVFSGVDSEERPIISKLLENEEYLETYHKYLKQISEEFVQSGMFNLLIDDADNAINQYVENDSTSFYSYSEYTTGLEALKLYGELRAQSILGQLDGTIPSTTNEQASSNALVDASALNLNALGTMGGGQGGNMQLPDNEQNGMDFNNQGNMQNPDANLNGNNNQTPPDLNGN